MEQSNTLENVNLQDKSESISDLKYTNIENTPFTIVEEKGEYFSIIGKHRITQNYESFEKCVEETKKITWDRIIQVIWAIAVKVDEINKLKNNNDE